MMDRIKNWFERYLEEPFYRAEVTRAEILKEESGVDIMSTLAISLSHNYVTMKSWSK